ncbi:hypothetical protein R3P38DRAFT_3204002 [Favolaschia claudopus]|uniref:Uncharacterized protein n=1 Tax=Favolaschia claudopus TaxID=2862362 RepID=A0AAW0ARZ2_9AGAR
MGSSSKTAPSRKRKGPTKPQLAARAANLRAHKEDLPSTSAPLPPPNPPPNPVVPAKDWKHEYQKLQRRHRHALKRETKLVDGIEIWDDENRAYRERKEDLWELCQREW